jgi:hypothetical protein
VYVLRVENAALVFAVHFRNSTPERTSLMKAMKRILKRYDQVFLAVMAVALLACAILLFLRVQSFGARFNAAMATATTGVEPSDLAHDRIVEARDKLANPPQWSGTRDPETTAVRGSLFVSKPYIVNPTKKGAGPEDPWIGSLYHDSLTGQPIPNRWFLEHGLSLTDPQICLRDPDKDHFPNEDEWRFDTDPSNPNSYPPFHTKLFLQRMEQVPFRMILESYDGDGQRDKPENLVFQIETLDLKQPTAFLHLGEPVPHTSLKLASFAYRTAYRENIKENEEVSELTLVDTETGEKVVLILRRTVNAPVRFAHFAYEWPDARHPQPIRVRKLQEFALPPEIDAQHRYRLLEVTATEARIRTPAGGGYTVGIDPRRQ